MKLINKSKNQIAAYTYLIKFMINDKLLMYYGVRYGNIRLKLTPEEDLFIKYFTSSKDVKNLLALDILPFEIIIHKTFDSINEACQYEVDFLKRVNAMDNNKFLNHVNTFKNNLAYSTKNRVLSSETKAKIGESSRKWQSSSEYKEFRRSQAEARWADPKFKESMGKKNDDFFKSEKGKSFIKNHLSQIWKGRKHKDSTKKRMSESAKKLMEKTDMRKRALNRKKYVCPICSKSNLDGGNFNSHMIKIHDWNKDDCQNFKKNNIL
jgi:hypothetical protein